MRLQANTLRLGYLSLQRRTQKTSANQFLSTRPQNPFDNLGYQLLEQPTKSEPQPVHRSVIDGLGPSSFTISGVRVTGSVLILPYFSTLWNVDSIQQMNSQTFSLINLMLPRPDMVIIGTGAQLIPVSPQLREFFKCINVNIDSMDTKNACHTFNVLNQEGRNAAAALLPVAYTHHRQNVS